MIYNESALTSKLHQYFSTKNADQVYLFGSYADGTQSRHSDIDLIIVTNTDKRFMKRFEDFDDLDLVINEPIDMLIYTPSEWKSVKQRLFFKNMFSSKRIKNVYSKEKS
jgi:predicted nucleotidyltransferase